MTGIANIVLSNIRHTVVSGAGERFSRFGLMEKAASSAFRAIEAASELSAPYKTISIYKSKR